MNFREILEDDFKKYSKEELELLLKHHKEDREEYKDKDTKAYDSSVEDIKGIEKVLKDLEDSENLKEEEPSSGTSSSDIAGVEMRFNLGKTKKIKNLFRRV